VLPLLRGTVPAVREEVLLAYGSVQRALVTPAWKLIEYPAAERTQLFDIASDPDELTDRAADPAARERRTDLEARLEAAQQAYDDPLLGGGPRRRRPPPPPPSRRRAG
jgi:arylsulfatase A-like enzyme